MKKHLLLLFASFLFTFSLSAQGDDNANDAAYNSGWSHGSNGGTGFGAWEMSPNSNNGTAGFFIGSSDINVGGESWGHMQIV